MKLSEGQQSTRKAIVERAQITLDELNDEIRDHNVRTAESWETKVLPALERFHQVRAEIHDFVKDIRALLCVASASSDLRLAWAVYNSGDERPNTELDEPTQLDEVCDDLINELEALPMEDEEPKVDKTHIDISDTFVNENIQVDCEGMTRVHTVTTGRARLKAVIGLGCIVPVFCQSCQKSGMAKATPDGKITVEWEA